MICPHCKKPFPRRSVTIGSVKAAEIMELHKRGYSTREIQELLGISFSSAARIIRAEKLKSGK